MVRELPTQTTAPLFSTLMFARFPNQSPLLTMQKQNTEGACNQPRTINCKSFSPSR